MRRTAAVRCAAFVTLIAGAIAVQITPAFADLYTCRSYSGRVLDLYGRGVSGAQVQLDPAYPSCPNQQTNPPSTATDASGQFTIYANTNATDAQVVVDASADGYIAATHLVAWAPGASATNNVSLTYAINGNVSPAAAQSGKTISFTARTKAPPPSSNPGARLVMTISCVTVAPCGGMAGTLTPAQGATDAAGYTSWLATMTSPPVDSYASVFICAVNASFTGDCSSAYNTPAAGTPNLVSDIYQGSLWVDNTAPYVAQTEPFAPYSDVAQVSWPGVDWADPPLAPTTYAGSGVDPSTIQMQLDGVPQRVYIDPYSVAPMTRAYFDARSASPGIHRIDTQAKDKAGNAASYSFDFDLTALADTPTGPGPSQAHLGTMQVPVAFGQTSPVVFHAPPISVDPFVETWNSSARAGSGKIDRPFSLGQVAVIFSYPNNSPLPPSQPELVTAPVGTATHATAVLSPSASALEAHIPAGSGTLAADISAPVPAGYNLNGAVATLQPASASLGLSQPHGGGTVYLTSSLSGLSATVSGIITTCHGATPTGGASSYCQADQNPQLQVSDPVNGTQPVASPVAPTSSIDPDLDVTLPVCSAVAGGQGCAAQVLGSSVGAVGGSAVAVFGCPAYQPTPQVAAFNLCTLDATPSTRHGYLGAYLNDWVLQDGSAGGGFPLWQQSHVEADPTGDRCPNGASGSARGTVERVVNGSRALDGATGALVGGTFRQHGSSGANALTVNVGSTTGATPASSDASGSAVNPSTGLGYELGVGAGYGVTGYSSGGTASSVGYNQVALGLIDAQGNIQPDPTGSSAASSWQADTSGQGSGLIGRVQLVAGSEFTRPASAGGYALASTLFVRFTADFSGCTGGT